MIINPHISNPRISHNFSNPLTSNPLPSHPTPCPHIQPLLIYSPTTLNSSSSMHWESYKQEYCNLKHWSRLSWSFSAGERVDLFESADPHMAAVLIKMFLRELPEPLLTFRAYSKVMSFGSKSPSIPPSHPHFHLLQVIKIKTADYRYAQMLCTTCRQLTMMSSNTS